MPRIFALGLGALLACVAFGQPAPAAPILVLANQGAVPGGGSETFNDLWCVSDQDLAKVDWHASTYPLLCADRPVTTSQTTCNSLATCTSALTVNGAEVTITGTGFSGNLHLDGDDVDLVVPSGVTLTGAVFFGSSNNCQNGPVTRLRVRGSTANTGASTGSMNGGLVGAIYSWGPSCVTHATVDGVQANGGNGSVEAFTGPARVAAVPATFVWVQMRAGADGGYAGDHMIWNHVSMAAAEATEASTINTGWGIRPTGGPTSIFNSHIRSHSHTTVRQHDDSANPGDAGMYFAIIGSKIEADAEGRPFQCFPDAPNGGIDDDTGPGDGCTLEDNDIYAYTHASCGLGGTILIDSDESRLTNNRWHYAGAVTYSQTTIDNAQAAAPAGTHTDSGNTFAAWTARPSWGGAGDPTGIPMPAGYVTPSTYGRAGVNCTYAPF